jgi:ribose 1,5-bisphosphokinase PhnN
MNIMLFGPPGIGKSTIIGILKTKSIGAIDLEDLYPNRMRFQIPSLVKDKVLGAADLDPKRKYPNAIKVLLTAKQDVYDQRRADRDHDQVGKANQKRHLVDDWLKGVAYDVVLDTTKLSAENTADKISKLLKEGEAHEQK